MRGKLPPILQPQTAPGSAPSGVCGLLAVAFAGFLLLLAPPSFAANHPPIAGKNADCSSCHADMLTGKSVHSQGEISCMLCHSAEPSDGTVKVTMTLALSGEKLCFACHERTAMQKHYPESQRDCLGCHDAHRSARAMLLRRDVDLPYAPEPASSTANAKGERLPPRSP